MKKIAYFINELDICGGTHKQLLKLLDYSSEKNLNFTVFTKRVNFDKTYKGFSKYKDVIQVLPRRSFVAKIVNKLGLKSLANRMDQVAVRKVVSECDIINIHDCGFEFLLPAFDGKKVVWQVNDLPWFCGVGVHSNQEKDAKKINRLNSIMKRNLRYVSQFTVNVKKNADRILDVWGRSADVFYCGVDPINIQRNVDESLIRFKQKEINLLSSGVFFPYRNYETQILVVKELVRLGWNVQLNIFGNLKDGAYAKKIQDMISEEKLERQVKIWGQIDSETFVDLHRLSDFFLFVNVDQSWGLAVFEAQSCGIPVIVSSSVGAVEILNDGKDSVFVDPKNVGEIVEKIVRLIEDESLYREIAANAKVFHLQWSWDKAYSSKMIELFKKV